MIVVGTRAFDKADPRHVGVVYRVLRGGRGGDCANLIWEETGWKSVRVPLREVRLARDEKPKKGACFLMKRAIGARQGSKL